MGNFGFFMLRDVTNSVRRFVSNLRAGRIYSNLKKKRVFSVRPYLRVEKISNVKGTLM